MPKNLRLKIKSIIKTIRPSLKIRRLKIKGGSSVSAVETDGLLSVERTVVDGRIVISNATDKVWNVRLVSLSGAVVAQDEVPAGTTELQVGHLRKGMYLLNLYRDGIQKTIKVIKK